MQHKDKEIFPFDYAAIALCQLRIYRDAIFLYWRQKWHGKKK